MPQLFKVGSYHVYFWANENDPLEPVYVHIAKGTPQPGATKVWITRRGKCLLAHNQSHIPEHVLRNIIAVIETQSAFITEAWRAFFGEARFFC